MRLSPPNCRERQHYPWVTTPTLKRRLRRPPSNCRPARLPAVFRRSQRAAKIPSRQSQQSEAQLVYRRSLELVPRQWPHKDPHQETKLHRTLRQRVPIMARLRSAPTVLARPDAPPPTISVAAKRKHRPRQGLPQAAIQRYCVSASVSLRSHSRLTRADGDGSDSIRDLRTSLGQCGVCRTLESRHAVAARCCHVVIKKYRPQPCWPTNRVGNGDLHEK